MNQYASGLLNTLFSQDAPLSPIPEVLHFKENLLGGISLTGNGGSIMETMSSAAGGETVMFENGETAHLTENIYGGSTLDFTGTANDIVSMPSIFGRENFYQGGELIGSMEPNFMGDGFTFSDASGQTAFTTGPDIFGGTEVAFTPSFDFNSFGQTFDLHHSFSDIEAITSQFSVVDLGSATDVLDGLDFLDFF